MHSLDQIAAVRYRLDEEPCKTAFEHLLQEADRRIAVAPRPVANFKVPLYYFNPDGHMNAKAALSDDAVSAYTLALAYQLETGERRYEYAGGSARILDAWASVNTRVSGGDGSLVMSYAGVPLIFAADLLGDYKGWPEAGRERFGTWTRTVFLDSAGRERRASNNHGAWGNFASIAACHLLDDRECVNSDIERLEWRIDNTIAPDGELPHENRRTNSGMWYTYFALAPMTGTANIAKNATGADLFEYESPGGCSIKLALDRLFEYCLAPETWHYERPGGVYGTVYNLFYPSAEKVKIPHAYSWPADLFEAMAPVYNEERWSEWVSPHRPVSTGRGWIYPTLMPPAFGDGDKGL